MAIAMLNYQRLVVCLETELRGQSAYLMVETPFYATQMGGPGGTRLVPMVPARLAGPSCHCLPGVNRRDQIWDEQNLRSRGS